MELKLSFGKLNGEGTKPVYMTNTNTKEKIFVMWYNPITDNPFQTKANWAIFEILLKAGYDDFRDYWNHNQKKLIK